MSSLQIENISDRNVQNNVMASAALLAGLVLEEEVIRAFTAERHYARVSHLPIN
ncbi:MAG: hypothetical protein PUP92_14920 [Rhizonema sp. PD38]|nr:hypothetical protein [Rhizonema sp. PD38]